MNRNRIQLSIAVEADRQTIYQIRHEVYAEELGQQPENIARQLSDACDDHNLYVLARIHGQPRRLYQHHPPGGTYSLDKYLTHAALPFPAGDTLYEVRLLTVRREDRGSRLAGLLMYAAFRLIEARGGTHIIGMGRQDLKLFYQKSGLRFYGDGDPVRLGQI